MCSSDSGGRSSSRGSGARKVIPRIARTPLGAARLKGVTMQRMFTMALAVTLCAIGVGCASDGAADNGGDNPPPQESPSVERLTGTLKSGFAGIGGEHTGWAMVVGKGIGDKNVKQIEVDVSKVRADAKAADGKQVTISGHYVEKKYVERGMTKIFVIDRIE